MLAAQIFMTPEAIAATRELRVSNPAYAGLDLRLYLAGKGCDGFEYGVAFDSGHDDDVKFNVADDVTILCDDKSLEFVINSVINWVDDERGRGFLVENPNHKKYRGKFYRKSSWKNSRALPATDSPQ